jgi:hypothetical protein
MLGVRVFTLVFDLAKERFSDDAVREFLADKDVESGAILINAGKPPALPGDSPRFDRVKQ